MANRGYNTVNIPTATYEAFYAAVRAKHGSRRGALSEEAANALEAYLANGGLSHNATPAQKDSRSATE